MDDKDTVRVPMMAEERGTAATAGGKYQKENDFRKTLRRVTKINL